MRNGGLVQAKQKKKKGGIDYTDEYLALLNHPKLLMNL